MNGRIGEILKLSEGNNVQELKAKTYDFLRDPFTKELKAEIAAVLDSLDKSQAYLIGAFNFFLFSIVADEIAVAYSKKITAFEKKWNLKKNLEKNLKKKREEEEKKKYEEAEKNYEEIESWHSELYDQANKFIKMPEVVDFILETYKIENPDIIYKKNELELLKVGTTSYIFRIYEINKVIKCIKLRYFGNRTIEESTRQYGRQFKNISGKELCTPKIYDPQPTHIVMEFIEGITLREYIKFREREDNNVNVFGNGLMIWNKLCDILQIFAAAKEPIHHLDLSPENILITETDEKKPKVYLIDFGYNYLLGDQIGNSGTFLKAQLYMAPELFEVKSGSEEQKLLADIYSLGIILIEMLSNKELVAQEIPSQLDIIAENYSSRLAQILQDMIDKNVETRLFEFPRDSSIFENIKLRIADELKLHIELQKKSSIEKWDENFKASFSTFIQLVKQFKYFKKNNPEKSSATKQILFFISIAFILTGFSLGAFFRQAAASFQDGSWTRVMPGYLVAASFSVTFLLYFINIFGLIDTRKSDPINQFSIRIIPFLSMFAILYTLLYDYRAWAFCSAFGVFFVALNNLSNYKFAKRAKLLYGDSFKERVYPIGFDLFLKEIKSWWILMLIYSITLLTVGLLLYFPNYKILTDEWAYAIIVVILNLKMAFFNSTDSAPIVRSNMDKAVLWYEKATQYQEKQKNVSEVSTFDSNL